MAAACAVVVGLAAGLCCVASVPVATVCATDVGIAADFCCVAAV